MHSYSVQMLDPRDTYVLSPDVPAAVHETVILAVLVSVHDSNAVG